MESMEQKTDLRVQRTYKLLTDSLLSLLEEKRYEDIQVTEICERAMVRRATFYKHFGNKDELFTFALKELQRRFQDENHLKRDPRHPNVYYAEAVDQMFQFVEENKMVASNLFQSPSSSVATDLIYERVQVSVQRELQEAQIEGTAADKPELVAPIFTGALVYTVKWWVSNDYQPPREELIDEFRQLLMRL